MALAYSMRIMSNANRLLRIAAKWYWGIPFDNNNDNNNYNNNDNNNDDVIILPDLSSTNAFCSTSDSDSIALTPSWAVADGNGSKLKKSAADNDSNNDNNNNEDDDDDIYNTFKFTKNL